MLRSLLHEGHELHDSDGFRLRGLGFSRLDGFSDVVFGFALTLLVVSLEVPRSFEELHHLWAGFLPFGISFLLLMLVWYGHYVFFRRFGTHDAGTVWINGVLLFVVLFYVYPLKFLFLASFSHEIHMTRENLREVVLLFSAGQGTIYLLFSALYANAYRQRERLELSPVECMLCRNFIVEEAGTGLIGWTVFLLALLLPPGLAGITCMTFLLIGVWKSVMGHRSGSAARRMRLGDMTLDVPPPANTASMTSE